MLFEVKNKYSDNDIKRLAYCFDRVDEDAFSSACSLVRLFTKSVYNSISFDDSMDGIACIDNKSGYVRMNREMIKQQLFLAVPFILSHRKTFPFLFDESYGSKYFNIDSYFRMFSCYLALHEIGHLLYTVTPDFVREHSANIIEQLHVPYAFIHFVVNVVEDSFIQRRFQLDYPNQSYRDFFLLGTTIVQGPFSVKNFVDNLNNNHQGTLSIKEKLFYLILRAYNPADDDVQSMFNMNPLIEWTPEVLELFDEAITLIDKEQRCIFTIEKLVPALFNILHEVVKAKQDELTTSGDNSSLLDNDKLREAEFDEQPSGTDGNPDSDMPEGDGQEKDCSGESDGSDSNDGESSDSQQESGESQESNESEKSNESEQSGGNPQKESSSSASESSCQDDQNSCAQTKTPDGKSLKDAAQELEDNFNKELEDASKELCKSLGESEAGRSYDDSLVKDLSDNSDSVNSDEVIDALCGIEKTEQISQSKMYNDMCGEKFSQSSQTLYNEASTLFKRIYNFDVDELSYLDNGEIDENIMIDFYTEKSLNIFHQRIDLVESKKIKIIFMIDDSGSMGSCVGSRGYNCLVTVPALIHAFEESGIKCSLYKFGSVCGLIKDFDDPAILVDNSVSNILEQMYLTDVGASTNITPALMACSMHDYSDRDETVYVMFVFTDGGFNNEETAAKMFKYLREAYDFNLFGVTIDQDCDGLKECMFGSVADGNDFVKNYSTDELITKLPQDIYNTIVDKFIRKN